MSGKPNVPFPAVQSFGCVFDLGAIKLIDIDIQNLRSIQRYFDFLAFYFDLLEIPFTHRA